MQSLASTLRRAIKADGRTIPEVAAAAGIDRALLWRFVTGRRDVKVETASAIIRALGLEARLVRRRKGEKQR